MSLKKEFMEMYKSGYSVMAIRAILEGSKTSPNYPKLSSKKQDIVDKLCAKYYGHQLSLRLK